MGDYGELIMEKARALGASCPSVQMIAAILCLTLGLTSCGSNAPSTTAGQEGTILRYANVVNDRLDLFCHILPERVLNHLMHFIKFNHGLPPRYA